MKSGDVLKKWLAAINGHDVEALVELMTPDFVFVNSVGNRVDGARAMEPGWRNYFTMCPDYWIRTDLIMSDGDTLLLAGEAGGTIDGQPWETPAAWKAVTRGAAVAEWRVFADNKPVYEILKRRRSS
ncbi:MAG TPA: nuclear transport factor 2 family protein [Bryobacteraceae bacterium]|nr:nuclear transport factor 2 family protein [Bryobacteraceae bacterium]